MTAIRALLVEDDDTDAMFLQDRADNETGHGSVVIERVDRLAAAVAHLAAHAVDVVLLDLGLPDSQGVETLQRLQQDTGSVAIVVLTGTDDREVAQQVIDAGAQDFIRKDQLPSLPLAQLLRHAVDRHRLQQELEANERQFRTLVEMADDALWRVRVEPSIELEYVSRGIEEITGLTGEQLLQDTGLFADRVHPDDVADWRDLSPLRAGEPQRVVYRWRRSDETWAWLQDRRTPIVQRGQLVAIQAITRDQSTMKEAELALQEALAQERAALDKLRSLDELKSSFLQAVSHELRTPLTVIQGFALTLREHGEALGPQQRSAMSGRLAAAADRLTRLLVDLMDVDRMNRGLLGVDRCPVRLQELVAAVVDGVDSASHRIVATCPGDLVATLDQPKVERIVENLVLNAVKHTPAGTRIGVAVSSSDRKVTIAVSDDGPGVDVRERERLFEPFSQGQQARLHPSPGTGIGLTLVARYAELHGGTAWLDTEAAGGATFIVELPTEGGPDGGSLPTPVGPPSGGTEDPPAATPREVAADAVRRIQRADACLGVTDAHTITTTITTTTGGAQGIEGPSALAGALAADAGVMLVRFMPIGAAEAPSDSAVASILRGSVRGHDRVFRLHRSTFVVVLPGADIATMAAVTDRLQTAVEDWIVYSVDVAVSNRLAAVTAGAFTAAHDG